jgi:hypothetical protein
MIFCRWLTALLWNFVLVKARRYKSEGWKFWLLLILKVGNIGQMALQTIERRSEFFIFCDYRAEFRDGLVSVGGDLRKVDFGAYGDDAMDVYSAGH